VRPPACRTQQPLNILQALAIGLHPVIRLVCRKPKPCGVPPGSTGVLPGSWDPSRGTDPALLAEFAALGVDRIVCTANESGAADVDTVVDFVGRMRDVLDEVSG
jgi:hypothetical protein